MSYLMKSHSDQTKFYQLMEIIKKSFPLFIILILSFLWLTGTAQIPAKPVPPRLVNDFASLLSADHVNQLERKLVMYNDTTSTQIVVITVASLDGYDIDDMAQRIGKAWGVGQSATDNGIVILIKPRIGNERGQAAISTGYGMEELIPDAIARRIVANEMIPYFKENNYYGGINAAVDIIFDLASGRFKAAEYADTSKESPLGILIPIIIIILVVVFMGKNKGKGQHNIGSSNLPLWILLSMLGSGGKGSSGGFGGGGGGGFGGFGGGGFGGGGASGSW
jgi:uncharacterized protein